MIWNICLLFVSLCVVVNAEAYNLSPPFDVENTMILPKGISSLRVRGLSMGMTEKFNATGSVEALSAKLNKQVTWSEVVKSQAESLRPVAEGSIQSLCESTSNCAEMGTGPGNTTGDVAINVNVMVPTYVRGITNKVSLILAVPIYSIDIAAQAGFAPSAAYQSWLNTMKTDPLQQEKISSNFINPVSTKLQQLGYKPLQSQSYQSLGDIKLGAKAIVWQDSKSTVAIKTLVSLPTGTPADPDLIVDPAISDGTYEVNPVLIWDYSVYRKIKLNLFSGFNYAFTDYITKRLPISAEDSLSRDKESVKRHIGTQYSAGTSFLVGNYYRGLSGSLGYTYQYMEPTAFSGSQFAAERYGYLSELSPSQSMQTALAVLNYSTIEYFREKRFALPLTVSLTYSRLLAGVNVTKSDLISTELMLYF